ncbi:hypothetical protein B0A49_13608, partial [Cryomyces minteri]
DILTYTNGTQEQHMDKVKLVLHRLRAARLQVDIRKCRFATQEVKYLGLIISTEGVRMDPVKTEAITNWQAPRNVHDVQAFLGFANFYRRFIAGFSVLAAPMSELTRTEKAEPPPPNQDTDKRRKKRKARYVPFKWTEQCQQSFEKLKAAFTSAPVLAHFDPDLEALVETDASDYIVAGVLSQRSIEDDILRPVAYFSKKMSLQECNYEIYDKELLAIVKAFEEWRPELAGTPVGHPVQVLTDHRNLEWFMESKKLNRRQARWAEFLSEFDFIIKYRPGKQGTKPDSLTRRSGDLPENDEDDRVRHQQQTVLKPHNLEEGVKPSLYATEAQSIAEVTADSNDFDKNYDVAAQDDLTVQKILAALRDENGPRSIPGMSLAHCTEAQGKLYFDKRLYIPDNDDLKLQILKNAHESPLAGHPGKKKLHHLLTRTFYWPGLMESVQRFTENANAAVETYLRGFVNYKQDDWTEWLASAEFAANNNVSETTGFTPFFANTGRHPRMGIEPTTLRTPQSRSRRAQVDAEEIDRFATQMQTLHEYLQDEMRWAQAMQEKWTNRHRLPPPAYRLGDKVWLSTRNLSTTRPSKKLDYRQIGPYSVTEIISPTTYKLDLPHDFQIHDVFHTNLLRRDPDDALPGQIPTPPPPLVLAEDEELNEWEVEEILDSRHRGRGVQYLVKYSGHPQPSWQPSRDLTNCDEALLAYHHTNSTKPVAIAFGSLLQAHMRVDPQRLTQITVNHSDNTCSNSSSN